MEFTLNEASTVFGDPSAVTVDDPDHSQDERRYLTVGYTERHRLVIVAHAEGNERIRIINARESLPQNGTGMKKGNNNEPDEMRAEYDLRGGVRGKYYERYKRGTNIVLLEPDLAQVFRDSDSVNKALRVYLSEHPDPSGE